MKNTGKMTCALQNGELKDIEEVENGLKCNCLCPSCGERLIAKKGNVKKHHFAHKSGINCEYGYETSLHLMAKDIFNELKIIKIPKVTLHMPGSNVHKTLYEENYVSVDRVELEKKIGDIVPDIVVYVKEKILLIEIYVTHKIDSEKLDKIKNNNMSVIEIDLSDIKEPINKKELTKILIDETDRKNWINNPKVKEWYNKYRSLAKRYPCVYRGMFAIHADYCPIKVRMYNGKPYANVMDDCIFCPYIVDVDNEDGILCTGDKKIDTVEDVKKYF